MTKAVAVIAMGCAALLLGGCEAIFGGGIQREMAQRKQIADMKQASAEGRDPCDVDPQCREIKERHRTEERQRRENTDREIAKVRADQAREREEEKAKQAERERVFAEQAKVEEKQSEDLTAFAKKPGVMRIVLSAEMCILHRERSKAAGEIATQHKYGRIGGAINLRDLKDLQDDLREIDEHIAEERGRFKEWKTTPLPCSASTVAELIGCRDDKADLRAICDDEKVLPFAELLEQENQFEPASWR
jgi:hypothetical protein